VASTGIAALLLDNGTTAHSRFKIPIPASETACPVPPNTHLGLLFQLAKLMVWDEACAVHKDAFLCVDTMLRDVRGAANPRARDMPFGGMPVVLAGDFRQTLPVMRRASRAQTVGASVRRCRELWGSFRQARLTVNMRAHSFIAAGLDAGEQQAWADYLLSVGNHSHGPEGTDMPVPPDLLLQGHAVEELVAKIYGDVAGDPAARTAENITHRAILACKNDDVDSLNATIINMWPGEVRELRSADTNMEEDEVATFPTEFLNSLDPANFPPHLLALKPGVPIMLLRNFDTGAGLANGTRLIVDRFPGAGNVIQATIVSGSHTGNQVLLPRLNLSTPESPDMPIQFRRRQFPVRPAFAITINKSQGQTFRKVGVYLRNHVFSHGQLYVAMSRVGRRDGVKLMVPGTPRKSTGEGCTVRNIVWAEALRD